ncbi:hypothetical protein [Sphingomonas sp. SRS2]|uniref:hypothetical protein n=1 Tax=Sphingomonas sp. SRS2 TaxID=133190 RepID=UPI0006184D1B|nr:hypothetical protein [Sphingomonas sp. SRS2]KKC26156.1 hypothetical protein WP12_10220 [Sphingomonas sp. SRS2]
MNPATIYLLIASVYLLIIAYGVVRTRKKGLPPHLRFASASAQVVLPPVALALVLLTTADAAVAGWSLMLGLLVVAGALLAVCTDLVARRVL